MLNILVYNKSKLALCQFLKENTFFKRHPKFSIGISPFFPRGGGGGLNTQGCYLQILVDNTKQYSNQHNFQTTILHMFLFRQKNTMQ